MTSPLWPATLDHFHLRTPDPDRLVAFYGEALGMAAESLGGDLWRLEGPGRRCLIGRGQAETVPLIAFTLPEADRLAALRQTCAAAGLAIAEQPTPLFAGEAFAVIDPDGLTLAFGTAEKPAAAGGLPGELQHIVFATTDTERQRRFYTEVLGFVESDRVLDDGALAAMFVRSDEAHHSYAAFRSDAARFDHFALDVPKWNTVRDWGDHFAAMHLPIWWGPGRHGPGDNLFFMVRDPDGNRIEISAELEQIPREVTYRCWPHEERTLNLWGQAWMRS